MAKYTPLLRQSFYYSLLIILLVLSSRESTAQNVFTPPKQKVADTIPEEKSYYSIPEIDFEIEKINHYLKKTKAEIKKTVVLLDKDTSFIELTDRIKKEADEFNSHNLKSLSKFFLENSYRVWSSYLVRLKDWQSVSVDKLHLAEKRNVDLDKAEKKWSKTYTITKEHIVPDILLKKMKEIQKEIREVQDLNYKTSSRIITYENKISDQVIYVENILDKIEDLQNAYRLELLDKTDGYIWQIQLKDSFKGTALSKLKRFWHENTKSLITNYPSYKPYIFKFYFFSFLVLISVFFIRRLYFRRFGDVRESKSKDIKYIIFQNPIASTFSFILLVFFTIFSNIPLAFSSFMWIILLFSIYISVRPYFSDIGNKLVRNFILLLLLNTFEILFWYYGDNARIFLLFESLISIFVSYQYIKKRFTLYTLPHLRYRWFINLIRYPLFVVFIVAFLANITGHVNLTVLLLKIGIRSIVIAITIIGLWSISISYLQVIIDLIGRHEKLRLNYYMPLIKKRINQAAILFFAYIAFNAILSVFELKILFYQWLDDFLIEERNIGNITLTYGSFFLMILIFFGTWALNAIVKIIFSEDNYSSMDSIRGIPAAISMSLRIVIISIGVFFAFSAGGVDMRNFSMILGALSVGIGFGLQNIVNNFISGLILIYERPVQKGDTVEVENLMGEVMDIGIRASNIRTFEGAEVIVPNANLISNQLINWTLSDKHRRLEIKVGVSYGSQPNQVIEILEAVANKHPKVVKQPAPRVLFDEFGDSSLNFRLLCWVLFEDGIGTKSDISISIFNAFAEKGIEIPFPQMDLHLKDLPEKEAKEEAVQKKIKEVREKKKRQDKEPNKEGEAEFSDDDSD